MAKIPGPDHPITITSNPKRVQVFADDSPIASSTQTLSLKEASYPVVHYIPRADVDMALLTRTDHTTHCPYKGGANYFSINVGGKTIENAIWTYEQPFDAVSQIAGYLAFYPNKVTIDEK